MKVFNYQGTPSVMVCNNDFVVMVECDMDGKPCGYPTERLSPGIYPLDVDKVNGDDNAFGEYVIFKDDMYLRIYDLSLQWRKYKEKRFVPLYPITAERIMYENQIDTEEKFLLQPSYHIAFMNSNKEEDLEFIIVRIAKTVTFLFDYDNECEYDYFMIEACKMKGIRPPWSVSIDNIVAHCDYTNGNLHFKDNQPNNECADKCSSTEKLISEFKKSKVYGTNFMRVYAGKEYDFKLSHKKIDDEYYAILENSDMIIKISKIEGVFKDFYINVLESLLKI